MSMPVVFLDKDGTLVKDIAHNVDISKIELAPYAIPSLKKLSQRGFGFAIITNQSGIALGMFTEQEILNVGRYLEELFKDNRLPFLGFYYCPHHPQGKVKQYSKACLCRKPLSGLIEKACQKHDIDRSRSWFIGDILDDVECGHRAGCKTILIDNGNETQWIKRELRQPDGFVKDFKSAAQYILDRTRI